MEEGSHRLHLSINAILHVDGKEKKRLLQTSEHVIDVAVSPSPTADWGLKLGVAAIIVLGGILAWVRLRQRRGGCPHAPAASISRHGRQPPNRAIFVSYARDDRKKADITFAALRGCVCWLETSEVMAGDHFGKDMEDNIKRRCGFLVSIISMHTETRREGWFLRERKWAAGRARFMPDGEPFYFPIVVDNAPLPPRQEPALFAEVHVARAPRGNLPEALVENLYELQRQLLNQAGTMEK